MIPLFPLAVLFTLPAQARTVLTRAAVPVTAPSLALRGLPALTPSLDLAPGFELPSLAASALPSLQLPPGLPSPIASSVAAPLSAAAPSAPAGRAVRAVNAADSERRPPAKARIREIERARRFAHQIENTPGRAADLLGGFFDGKGALSAGAPVSADAVPKAPKPPGRGWTEGALESSDGTSLVYHRRGRAAPGKTPRIFVGGLALAQSFDVHFARGPAPERLEYRLNLRGLIPSGWSPTRSVIDADARDLAKLVVRAARESGSSKVELALHSYAALVLQRMVQLADEPEVGEALALLKGARVTLFGPTTHVPGSEALMGPQMEALAFGLRRFVESIDYGDMLVEYWRSIARWNPFLLPQAFALESAWRMQRQTAIALAVGDIERMLKQDLSQPWPPEIEPSRQRMLAEVDEAARHGEWQEAALRRVRDGFDLDFDDESAARLRSLGARLRVVYSHDDALLPWKVERLLLGKLGIETPEKLPKAGTVLRGPDGIEAVIASGDHYLPLMRYNELPEHLER
ncbi:MAG: hypothetical protein CO113_11585 [Elusimicrobia bacterium CG_4_9_14_3_um_filter_62_55]|nr:MAG: hypothetical protein COR54_00350 [Elusimicrobia bacterium CG22_combo_CG10-13_8_21_14_all_63_91]PJA15773.1 MAG: hypothetical protein COX66_09095 [Elusimicrobia bacterium CG_4_10_14_0_2_um_filter_63_34]PJB24865.1 MAG: hypothetical protein CO113_11585 [Elusimicrobia bacterium CG_4_9_14_3_um_filter_62_55]